MLEKLLPLFTDKPRVVHAGILPIIATDNIHA